MRLSEAIVLGLLEIKFTNSCWIGFDGDQCSGCLVGAALKGSGLDWSMRGQCYDLSPIESFYQRWPWVKDQNNWSKVALPCGCSHQAIYFQHLLTHLAAHYEYGHLTADAIADWIRSIEPPEIDSHDGAETSAGRADTSAGLVSAPPSEEKFSCT